jgi:hypothetical protein
MYQLKFKGMPLAAKKQEIESKDFQLARKLASKALLYILGKETKDSVEFSRKAYIVISKL